MLYHYKYKYLDFIHIYLLFYIILIVIAMFSHDHIDSVINPALTYNYSIHP